MKIFEASEAQISNIKNFSQVKKILKDFSSHFKTTIRYTFEKESEMKWSELHGKNHIVFPLTFVEEDTYLIINNYQDSDENIFMIFFFALLQRINISLIP